MGDFITSSTITGPNGNAHAVPPPKYSHYFRACPYDAIDIYRVLKIFEVADPCLQHAIKKLLVAGGRGTKSAEKDIHEAIDSLKRWQEMRDEDASKA